jgi:hypothetical protein
MFPFLDFLERPPYGKGLQRKGNFWQRNNFYDKMLPAYHGFYHRKELPMSIAGAITGRDAMVLVADSRTTEAAFTGEFRFHDTAKKCWRISKYAGIAYTGMIGYAQWFVELFKDKAETEKWELEEMDITKLVEYFSAFANNYFSQYANDSALGKAVAEASQYRIDFILAGYTKLKESKIALVRHSANEPGFLPQFIGQPYKFFGAYIVSSHLMSKAESVLAQLGENELKHLATIVLLETYTSEASVGGPIQMLVIPQNGSAFEVETSDLDKIKTYVKENIQDLDKRLIEILRHS